MKYYCKAFCQLLLFYFFSIGISVSNLELFPAPALLLSGSQLKSRILKLESQLGDERKKSEELQFSIDEAQFCGDEMNVRAILQKGDVH